MDSFSLLVTQVCKTSSGHLGEVFCFRYWLIFSLSFCLYLAATCMLSEYFVHFSKRILIYLLYLPIKNSYFPIRNDIHIFRTVSFPEMLYMLYGKVLFLRYIVDNRG